jgi:predicted O-methyltransferase YrrM
LREYGLENRSRTLRAVKKRRAPIEVVFNDADKPGYPDYLQKLLTLVRPVGLILGHNMRRPEPSPDPLRSSRPTPTWSPCYRTCTPSASR